MSTRIKTWHIAGMHCPHCETAILRAINGLDGLTAPQTDYRTGTLTALYDESQLSEAALADRIAQAGYELKRKSKSIFQRILTLIAVAFALFILYLLFCFAAGWPAQRLSHGSQGHEPGGAVLSGTAHIPALRGHVRRYQPCAKRRLRPVGEEDQRIQYNAGRLISYTVVGGAVGTLGSALRISTNVQAAIQILAAALMVLMALNMLDLGALKGMLPSLPMGLRGRLLGKGRNSSLWIGLVNGLMPCGPLQAMQLYALSVGSWYMGALSMACFCLGTIPLMLGFGLVSGKMNKKFARPMRIASGVLVLVMGMAMLTRGLSLSGMQVRLPARTEQLDAVVVEEAYQTVNSELEWRGYPDITVKAGVPVRWVIHAKEERITGCNNEMVIPGLNLRVPLQEGDNVIEFTAAEPGVIPYTCWMGMLHGSIMVQE